MARNQTVNRFVPNIFALNRLRKDCYYEPIRVDFCPIQKPNRQTEPIIPCFNHDGHYFTPSFILPRQKITEEQHLRAEKNKFQTRVLHSQRQSQEKTPEYKPTDNDYCQLCQQHFDDYWEHINSKYHKRMINSSKFNKDIMALCQALEKTNQTQNPAKTKTIEKKKVNNKSQKYKNQKDKINKPPQQLFGKDCPQTLEHSKKDQEQVGKNEEELRKNIEQSLKITLQLANHSTNMLSNNTFKEFCKNS